MKHEVEKWYLDELKRRDKKRRLDKVGLNPRFFSRKHKRNFSLFRFIKYVFNHVMKEVNK